MCRADLTWSCFLSPYNLRPASIIIVRRSASPESDLRSPSNVNYGEIYLLGIVSIIPIRYCVD